MAQRELDALLAEVRAEIAAGRTPDTATLEGRVRALGGGTAELGQLERVVAVHRARSLLARTVEPLPRRPSLRAALRTKPTISANMDVRRESPFVLVWDPAPAVVSWEVRLSERADARAGYSELETRMLVADVTRVELPLGDRALQVHVLGRSRNGRLLRRAVIAGLTREGWGSKWQRRASAS